MARVGLLLLVGALAASATTIFDETFSSPTRLSETVLRPGVEYTYKYDSQVLTGIPNGGNQYSGLKLKCLVRLVMKSPGFLLMKLDEIKLCEVNSDLRSSLPSEMISDEFCTPSTSEHVRVMTSELYKPISFRYDNGLVSRLETDTSDPFWSVNIKRGVLNLFSVSLSQEREVMDVSPERMEETSDYTLRNIIMKDRSFDKVFKVKEHDVVGDCETLYAIYEKDPTTSYCSECFYVTKVKDYKRCTNKAVYEQGLFAGHTSFLWLSHEHRKPLITPVTHVTYEMSGSRSHFLIHKAKLHSEYIFTPYTAEGGSMVTYIKCHLSLIGAESPRTPIVVGPTPMIHNHALLLHLPHALTTKTHGMSSYPKMSRTSPYGEYTGEYTGEYNREYTGEYNREYTGEYNREYTGEPKTPFGRSTSGEFESTWEKPEYMSNKPTRKFGVPEMYEDEEEEGMWEDSTFSKWESAYKKFDWTRDFTTFTPSSNIDKVRVMLKEIMSSMTPYITEETATKLIHLKRVLETCTSDELWTIVYDMCSTMDSSEREFTRIREIILDLLPVIPRPIVPHIIRSLVSKNIIYPKRGAYMISLYSLMAPARPRIVKSMLSVCKHPIMMTTDEQLKRTCILGLGTVTHKLFAMHLKTNVPKFASYGVIDEVISFLKSFLTTTSHHDKMLALKAIGNTGLPEFIPELHRIVREKTSAPIIRKLAVYALRRMTILAPYEVNKIVLPVFMNPRETSEMRIACFLMSMYTKPKASTVLLMVHRLRDDPSHNLKSFVYSYLSSLAKSTLPLHYYSAKNAKLAMLTMKPYDYGFEFSKGYHFDFNFEKLDLGAIVESFLVHTSSSSLPKGFVVKLGSVLAHKPLYLFETGMEVKGMDDIINTVYQGTRPMWSKLSSYDWSRVMTPEWYREVYPEVSSWFSSGKWDWMKNMDFTGGKPTEWGNMESTMRDILGKIKFEDRTYELPEVLTYFKILSNQVTFFNADGSIISDILSNTEWFSTIMSSFGGRSSSIPVNVLKTLPLVDNCYVIPTPIGMPLHLNFSAMAITKITGHVTPVNMPTLRDMWFSRSWPEEIKAVVDIKPSFALKMLCEMGVHFNIMKTTTLVKGHVIGHLPIKSEVTFNTNEKKFKLNWEVPQESFTPLKVGMKVATKIFKLPLRYYDLITPSMTFEKDITHPSVLKQIPFTVSPITTVFGTHVAITSELWSRRSSWAPYYPLCGRFHFRVTCTPTEDRPKLAEFKVIFGSSFPSEYYTSRSPTDRSESSLYGEWDVLSPIFPGRKDYTSSIRDEFESDFNTVTPYTEISSPRSRHVTMIMRTLGGSRSRFVQSHMTWIHSYDYLNHQFNCQLTGSPIFGWYSTPVKVMFDGVLNLKTLFYPYLTSDSLVAKADFYYGDRTYTESDFSLKVLSGRTGVSWESEYSPLYNYPWSSTIPSSEKYEYYCTFKYNSLPIMLEEKLVHGLELLKVMTFPYLYVKKTGLTSETNKVIAYIKVVPSHKKLSAIINTPTELDFIVDLPTFNPMFSPETVSLSVPSPVLMSEGFTPSSYFTPEEYRTSSTSSSSRWTSWYKSMTGVCSVSDNTVKTFDEVSYSLPEMPTMCETILARDCSSMSKWMVTMAPMTSSYMKMVRVMVPHFEFKVMPGSSAYDLTFYVNSVPKTLSSSQPIYLSDTGMSSYSSDYAYTISKEGDMIKIECLKHGITILTNGKHIMIRSSSMYRGRVCGMCGNFDGKSINEYEGPLRTIYERPEHFVVKYTIPSTECSVSDLVTKYKVPEYTYSGECMHEMRNVAKVTRLNGEKVICFTLKPEPVCGETCKRVNSRPKYVSFHCLPANDVTAQGLLRESRTRVLSELAWKPVSIHDYIDTQDMCVSV